MGFFSRLLGRSTGFRMASSPAIAASRSASEAILVREDSEDQKENSFDGLSEQETLKIGNKHNSKIWKKHIAFVSQNGGDSHRLISLLSRIEELGSTFTRQHVFDIADADAADGVMATIIWGFPKGGRPGGVWKPFAEAFVKADEYSKTLASLRSHPTSAAAAIDRLNQITNGVGFATTSKIAYFARIRFSEGDAVIFDSNVIKAVRDSAGQAFLRTRSELGSGKAYYHKAVRVYGTFLREASHEARTKGVTVGQIEAGLFFTKANPRSGWNPCN